MSNGAIVTAPFYLTCILVISMQMFDLDSGALAILLNDFCSVLVL